MAFNFQFQVSNLATQKMHRRRPLYTCIASIFEIIHIACRKVEDFNGPIGSLINKIAVRMKHIMPILYAMEFQWLSVLSLVDNCALTSEIVIEKLFPPSSRLFDKIDELACVAECLPGKFHDTIEKLPMIIHQVPFLDWALAQLISWLNFWISCLTSWGSKNAREKEITIDMYHNDQDLEEESTVKDVKHFSQFPNFDASQEQFMENEKSECGVDEKKVLRSEIQPIEEAISPACSSTCDPFEDAVSSPLFDSHEDVIIKPIETETTYNVNLCKYSYKEMLEKMSGEKKEENLSIV
ncbi:hypothetical protein P3S67_027255 [Capsicum chacoense]